MKKPLVILSSTLLSASLLAACSAKPETTTTPETTASTTSGKSKENTVAKGKDYKDYTTYKKQIEELKVAIDKYKDINVALQDGYEAASGYVPMMGYHFVNKSATEFVKDKPNTLMYTYKDGKFVLIGAEWSTPDIKDLKVPLEIQTLNWELGHKASAHYEDGTELEAVTPEDSLPINPDTKAKFTEWHPDFYSIHVYTHVLNPNGPFVTNNPAVEELNDSPPMLPPGFEDSFKKKN